MNVDYLGGVAKTGVPKRDVVRRLERFLETQPIYETKTMLLDCVNLFQRKFMCCKENCDFRVNYEKEDRGRLFNDTTRIVSCDHGCCEGGSLDIPASQVQLIDKAIKDIYPLMMPECRAYAETHGWSKKVGKYWAVRSYPGDNRCVFSIVEDGMNLCALHRYALLNDKPVTDYKPFECWMFPMDILEVDGKVLLTCISEVGDTYGFLRWGDMHCIQSCLRNDQHGIPFYQYSKDVIVSVVGQKRYDFIDKLYKSGRWKQVMKEKGRL